MNQSHLLQKLASIGIVSTISAVITTGIILTLEIENKAQAATFTEIGLDAGELIPQAQGPVTIPLFDTIEGSLLDTGDIDLYELRLDFDADVTIDLGGDLFLFDEIGRGLRTGSNQLSFSGVAGEIFYLGVNGTVALNANGETILDPSIPDFVGSGTLTSWVNPGIVLPVITPYQVSVTATSSTVPESSSNLALLALSTLGVALNLKRKLRLSKSTDKETTKAI